MMNEKELEVFKLMRAAVEFYSRKGIGDTLIERLPQALAGSAHASTLERAKKLVLVTTGITDCALEAANEVLRNYPDREQQAS